MADERDNEADEEQRQVISAGPMNEHVKRSHKTQLSTALKIVDQLLSLRSSESLIKLKKILVNEEKNVWKEKQKVRQLMDENRRLREQITRLKRYGRWPRDNNQKRSELTWCDQSPSKRKRKEKNIRKYEMSCSSEEKRNPPEGNNCTKPATNRELETCVLQEDDPERTILLAIEARRKQGLHESEFSYAGESDLQKHFNDCEKNPGHKQFVPICEFSKQHLPTDNQGDDIVKCIQALAKITVRVDVIFDGLESKRSATQLLRTATGWILVVKKYPVWYSKKDCPCQECQKPSTPKKEFAEILVYTAGHHVRDERDGRNTRCWLFFDNEGRPDTCDGVESFTGAVRVVSDPEGDRCEMTFVTHDLRLADKLHELVKQYRDLNALVSARYLTEATTAQEQDGQSNKSKLTVIISHPHGYSKQVTVGFYTQREELREGRDVTRYTYTTPTCCGSSGAPVYILGKPAWGMCEHPHSGISAENPEENTSGYGLF